MKKFTQYLPFPVLFLAFWVFEPVFAHQLPDLGNEFRSVLSVSDERLIGEMVLSEVRASGMSHPDPLVHEYVQHLGNKLTPYIEMPYSNMQIKFFAIHDNTINAFAFFGGNVAIHSGLIKSTETESELAGVMAHELAHISQQHVLRQMADSKRMMPVTIAEVIAAVAIGVPELILPAVAGHAQKMINYTRQYEQEADRLGLQILNKAQFDPQGLPNILERMSVEMRYNNKPPEYLLTHPLFETRLADTRHRANSFAYKQQVSSNMFNLVKARITVQSTKNLQHFIEEHEHILNTQRYKNKLAANYTYAYALLQKGQLNKAWDALYPLTTAYPDDLIIQMTAIEIEMLQHKHSIAMQRMRYLLEIFPDSPTVLLKYASLLIYVKQPLQARSVLVQYQSMHKPDPLYYECVRLTEGMLGNQTAVYEANAEWFVLHGDMYSAFKQLELALEQKNQDKKIINRIKARQAALQELLVRMKSI